MDRRQSLSLKGWLQTLLCGFCMGCADLVPGISGGTVAFILGFYERLIGVIKSFDRQAAALLCTLRFKAFHQSYQWDFLAALLAGIAFAIFSLAHLIEHLLNSPLWRPAFFSAFFGLVIASAWVYFRKIKTFHISHWAAFLTAAAAAYLLTMSSPQAGGTAGRYHLPVACDAGCAGARNYDAERGWLLGLSQETVGMMMAKGVIGEEALLYEASSLTPVAASEVGKRPHQAHAIDLWVIACGVITVSAMLLPGISGSYLMVLVGMYPALIGAVADFSAALRLGSWDGEAFLFLSNFLVGLIIGALAFSRVISWALSRYHDITVAALLGVIIGALRAVWPFWSYEYLLLPLKLEKGLRLELVEPIMPPIISPLFLSSAVIALAAFGAVLLLEKIVNSTACGEKGRGPAL